MNVFICILACGHSWHLSCLHASPHHPYTQSQPAADLCLPVVGPYHSHPSDLKHRFHRHQSSTSLHGSFNHNHVQDTNLPLVTEEHDENSDGKGPVYDPKQDVFVSLFVSLHGNGALTCEVALRRFPICFLPVWEFADNQMRRGDYRQTTINTIYPKQKSVINLIRLEFTQVSEPSYQNGDKNGDKSNSGPTCSRLQLALRL